jgi:hypothetical protein
LVAERIAPAGTLALRHTRKIILSRPISQRADCLLAGGQKEKTSLFTEARLFSSIASGFPELRANPMSFQLRAKDGREPSFSACC